MSNTTTIINILTYGLPYKLANQIFNEHKSRLSEAKYIINLSDRYAPLNNQIETVELILAITIFHKRVIANLDSAVKFYGKVNRVGKTDTIKMGSFEFTNSEKNKLLGLTMNYKRLIEKFGLTNDIHNYDLTKELLVKILTLLRYEQQQSE